MLLAKVIGLLLLLIFAVFYKPSNEIRPISVCVIKVVGSQNGLLVLNSSKKELRIIP
jgi:hypothetical protein